MEINAEADKAHDNVVMAIEKDLIGSSDVDRIAEPEMAVSCSNVDCIVSMRMRCILGIDISNID